LSERWFVIRSLLRWLRSRPRSSLTSSPNGIPRATNKKQTLRKSRRLRPRTTSVRSKKVITTVRGTPPNSVRQLMPLQDRVPKAQKSDPDHRRRGAASYIPHCEIQPLGRREIHHDVDFGQRGRPALHNSRYAACAVVHIRSRVRRGPRAARRTGGPHGDISVPASSEAL
jgi:hypothetical protein